MEQVVCREKYGSESLRKSYIRGNDDQLRTVDLSRRFGSASDFFRVSSQATMIIYKVCTKLVI